MKMRAILLSLVYVGFVGSLCASMSATRSTACDWYSTTLHSFNQIAAQVEYVHEHALVLDDQEKALIIDGVLGLYATAQWALQGAHSNENNEEFADQDAYVYLCNVYVLVDRALGEIKQFFTEDQRSYLLYIRETLAELLTQL